MGFIRRQSFGCHVPFLTVPPDPEMELRARLWDPAMIVDPAAGCIHIDSHAREVLIDERLLLPDDGVVYLNWKLAGWLASIPGGALMIGDHTQMAGRRRAFDAFAMLVPTAFSFIMTVSLRGKGRAHAAAEPGLQAAADIHHLPDHASFKP
jgi:hypothetical protein